MSVQRPSRYQPPRCHAVEQEHNHPELSRRRFLSGVAVIGAASVAPKWAEAETSPAAESAGVGTVPLRITINGQAHQLTIDPRVTLLDLLRENLGLTGTKKGCDHGQCGACTVLANDRRINSCLSLAVSHDSDRIVTVEGLAHGTELDPLQSAFIEHDGFQCGYCTPGQLCSAVAMLREHNAGDVSFVTRELTATGPVPLTDEEIRERISGNICRCGAYPGIVAAVRAVSGFTKSGEKKENGRG